MYLFRERYSLEILLCPRTKGRDFSRWSRSVGQTFEGGRTFWQPSDLFASTPVGQPVGVQG